VGDGPVNVRIDVDGGGYLEACDAFYDANHGVVAAVSKLTGTIDGLGGMAGTDTGGESWAAQYDPAAAQAVQAGCDLGASLATMANLLNASLVNHDSADGGAMLYGPPQATGQSTGDHDPDHWTEELLAPAPPSAKGGTGDQPGWWHWIAGHVEGLLWPDADTGKLRSAGSAWTAGGDAIDGYKYDAETASAMVGSQTSPEVHDAVAACDEIAGHISDLATAYRSIGKACTDYAQAVDDHHQEIEDELKSFIEWTIAIEAGGAIVGFFTLGLGEGAAQAAEAAEVANAGSKVVRILKDLIEVARTVATTVGEALTRIGEIAGKLGKFLNAKIERALIKLGVKEAEELFPRLSMTAQQLKKKYKHAEDLFGLSKNYNLANASKYEKALDEFMEAPSTIARSGTYRNQEAILNYDESTGQLVIQHPDGTFWSGWKMSPEQLEHAMTDGHIGGG
jgi:hypothetical protein